MLIATSQIYNVDIKLRGIHILYNVRKQLKEEAKAVSPLYLVYEEEIAGASNWYDEDIIYLVMVFISATAMCRSQLIGIQFNPIGSIIK